METVVDSSGKQTFIDKKSILKVKVNEKGEEIFEDANGNIIEASKMTKIVKEDGTVLFVKKEEFIEEESSSDEEFIDEDTVL